MLSLVCLAATSLPPAVEDAKATLLEVMAHYQTLDTFEMTIEHHDSSGLFPGEYTQSLKWKKGGRFELKTTKDAVFASGETRKVAAPNYYSDGTTVTSINHSGERTQRSVTPEPNITPGWEVSGGLILSFLQKTPLLNLFNSPPAGFKIDYTFGNEKTWKGQAARDITFTMGADGSTRTIHFFLADKESKLLGMQLPPTSTSKDAYVEFKNQKENPRLSEKLGSTP